jgi:large subunit ribosomal protein L6
MSRIGRRPVQIPKGVEVNISPSHIEYKGPKGTLNSPIPSGIEAKVEDGWLRFERSRDELSALHGLARALAANALKGVFEGFICELDIIGVGYKAEVKGSVAVFNLGYSHPIEFPIPQGIEVKVERKTRPIQQYQMSVTVSGIDKQEVGQVAANIRRLRRPDAYKGKGVRYANEVLKLKPGKAGKAAG